MFENPRRGRQARKFTTNAPKILDLKSSSEQIFSRKLPLGAPVGTRHPEKLQTDSGGEFYNSKVQAFFKKQGVHHFSTHGDPHGSVVERWNHSKQKFLVILRLKTRSSILMCYRL